MSDVLACRACLSVDVKLYHVRDNALDTAFKTTFQIVDCPTDPLPQYLCSFCRALSKRCDAFLRQCRTAQQSMRDLIVQHGGLTKELLQSMDRKPTHQCLKLTTSRVEVVKACEDDETDDCVVKQEVESVFVDVPSLDDDEKWDDDDKWDAGDDDKHGDDFDIDDEAEEKPAAPDPSPGPAASKTRVSPRRSVRERSRRLALNEYVETIVLTHEESSGSHLCAYCRKYFPSAARLRKHAALQHDCRYVCRRCGREDRTKRLAFSHQQWHRGVRFECDTCGASYKHKMNIQRHIASAHPAQLGRDLRPTARPVCRSCRLTFFSAAAFARHLAAASRHTGRGDDTHHCRECGASFPRQAALLAHARAAHPASGDVVECEQCGKVCYASEYPRHSRRAHPGALPYKYRRRREAAAAVCEVCGRKCANKYALRNHLMTHTGERPFQCRFCPKRKISKEQLKVHTGEKPYACSYCGKCFSQSNSMKLHVATVHHKLPAPYKRKPRAKKTTAK